MRFLLRAVPLLALPFAAACDDLFASTPAAVALAPVTGLQVRAAAMMAGVGCASATSTTQAHKWGGTIRVKGATEILGARVVDCFADLVFNNLPVTDAAANAFEIDLVAFTSPAWNAILPAAQAMLIDGQAASLAALPATWRSSCEGTSEPGIRREVVCVPYTLQGGASVGVTFASLTFGPSDGGTASSIDAATNADSGDPSDAGTGACPSARAWSFAFLAPTRAPASGSPCDFPSFSFDLPALSAVRGTVSVESLGGVVREASCSGSAQAGLHTELTCNPLQ